MQSVEKRAGLLATATYARLVGDAQGELEFARCARADQAGGVHGRCDGAETHRSRDGVPRADVESWPRLSGLRAVEQVKSLGTEGEVFALGKATGLLHRGIVLPERRTIRCIHAGYIAGQLVGIEADRISPLVLRPSRVLTPRRIHATHNDGLLSGSQVSCARLEGHALRGAAVFQHPRDPHYEATIFWAKMHKDQTLARWERALHARAQNQIRSQ